VTEEQQLIASIIREQLPHEVDLVGEAVLIELVQGRRGGQTTTGASADLSGAVAVLLSAVTLLKSIIEIIKLRRELNRKAPAVDEIEAELVRRLVDPRPAHGIPTSLLIRELLKRLPRA
jgi:hypothetical protein